MSRLLQSSSKLCNFSVANILKISLKIFLLILYTYSMVDNNSNYYYNHSSYYYCYYYYYYYYLFIFYYHYYNSLYSFTNSLFLLLVNNESGHYNTELFTAVAEKIINEQNASMPLFLYIAHQAIHSGNIQKLLQAPKRLVDVHHFI